MRIPERQNVTPMPPVKPPKKKRTRQRMNDDLISREALKKAMWNESHFIATFTGCVTEEARLGLTFSEIEKIIGNAPTVEQECYITGAQWDEFMKEHKRPHGEWIELETNPPNFLGHRFYICSKCNREIDVMTPDESLDDYPYCHCGACMIKEEEKP